MKKEFQTSDSPDNSAVFEVDEPVFDMVMFLSWLRNTQVDEIKKLGIWAMANEMNDRNVPLHVIQNTVEEKLGLPPTERKREGK